ncbi:GDP-mannose 4,6-dehydratase [Vibrio hepatarius]|uniref:GDP-mannose 4,6-dehydratase n=1 Tax=Vibrio hepatarius TaxID=171383 RepID=UPI001C084534|nr:GDP-mannose 4,6-dehydratase [Vibrio hepatarius]MBU2896870.1 GDP-mannose 4,6-dehydratase [Vibrio hepatarius]
MKQKNKKALICGVSGQDGGWLSKFLISKGYEVWGTTRKKGDAHLGNLRQLGIQNQVMVTTMNPENYQSVFEVIKASSPDEVYYLAGQSSVGMSFVEPVETISSIALGTLNVLEACRKYDKNIRIYNAGSGECFGDTKGRAANENTPFKPQSPYAAAKVSAYWFVNSYRESYGMYACTGILFNHESPLRPKHFVTQKVISTARQIAGGDHVHLELGCLDISRDWGWAPEYVEAMWLMLQKDNAEDYVIATGVANSLEDFVCTVFKQLGMDWKEYVKISNEFHRPNDIRYSCGDATKANINLGWKPSKRMKDIIPLMIKKNKVNYNE